jgi:hypothetical protein
VPTPANRGPGQPWRPGTPPPAPIPADTPSADIRVGYARCSHLTQELQSQLDALTAHGIPREKIFAEKGLHPRPGPPEVRGRAGGSTADQGPRPALPGHLHRLRDETAGAVPRGTGFRVFSFFTCKPSKAREAPRLQPISCIASRVRGHTTSLHDLGFPLTPPAKASPLSPVRSLREVSNTGPSQGLRGVARENGRQSTLGRILSSRAYSDVRFLWGGVGEAGLAMAGGFDEANCRLPVLRGRGST